MLMWALATAGVPLEAELVQVMSSESVSKCSGFNPQAITNLIWALATASAPLDAALLHAMSSEAMSKVADFKPQNISNLLWGLAKLGVPLDPALVRVMSSEAVSKASDFKPQNISNLMWALATSGVSSEPALVQAMSSEAVRKARGFNPQAISNLVLALATSRVPLDVTFVQAMSSEAVSKRRAFNAQAITSLMWALATARVPLDAALLQAMSSEAMSNAGDFKPQEISSFMWALATLGVSPDAALSEAMLSEAVLKGSDFKPKEVANLLYALAIFDVSPDVALVRALLAKSSVEDFTSEERPQLHQFFLFNFLSTHSLDLSSWAQLAAECKAAFVALSSSNANPSALQEEVAYALQKLVSEELLGEQVLKDSGYSVDIQLAGIRVVVEIDGPNHYLRGTGQEGVMDGRTQFKTRILRQLGYTVLQVPYFQWTDMKNAQDKARYLSTLLANAGLPIVASAWLTKLSDEESHLSSGTARGGDKDKTNTSEGAPTERASPNTVGRWAAMKPPKTKPTNPRKDIRMSKGQESIKGFFG
jgi:very-short-patch-repair endonuclease